MCSPRWVGVTEINKESFSRKDNLYKTNSKSKKSLKNTNPGFPLLGRVVRSMNGKCQWLESFVPFPQTGQNIPMRLSSNERTRKIDKSLTLL